MDLLQRAHAPETSPLSKYEVERMQRIEANRKRMGEGPAATRGRATRARTRPA